MHGERTTCAGPARCDPGAPRRSRRAGHAYDPAQNLARRTNNASGSTVTATVNALNQLTAGLGFSGSLAYDRRGNLLSIGSAGSGKAYAYDHENQCITAGWFNAYTKSDFVYDGKGRLRKRTDYTWNGSSWTSTGETRYVYDGMLLLKERTSAGHPAVTYTRGSDLSGTLAGAGGIGGLLARTAHSSTSPYQPSTSAYYHADGNGNVAYLLNQDRSHGASYKYDPYGRLIASSGGLAAGNLMRFSSKPWHDHSETYYYGYRFYLPEGQRWINRDPIGEEGGINLYSFTRGRPTDLIDPIGYSSAGRIPHWVKDVVTGKLAQKVIDLTAGWAFGTCSLPCMTTAECQACCGKVAALATTGALAIAAGEYLACGLAGPLAIPCIAIVTVLKAQAILAIGDAYQQCIQSCP